MLPPAVVTVRADGQLRAQRKLVSADMVSPRLRRSTGRRCQGFVFNTWSHGHFAAVSMLLLWSGLCFDYKRRQSISLVI